MMNQNEEHEDILFEEKKKQTDRREAGMGADGEFSAESLKRWSGLPCGRKNGYEKRFRRNL